MKEKERTGCSCLPKLREKQTPKLREKQLNELRVREKAKEEEEDSALPLGGAAPLGGKRNKRRQAQPFFSPPKAFCPRDNGGALSGFAQTRREPKPGWTVT